MERCAVYVVSHIKRERDTDRDLYFRSRRWLVKPEGYLSVPLSSLAFFQRPFSKEGVSPPSILSRRLRGFLI